MDMGVWLYSFLYYESATGVSVRVHVCLSAPVFVSVCVCSSVCVLSFDVMVLIVSVL